MHVCSQSADSLQRAPIHILIKPKTLIPWVFLASPALDVLADRIRAFATAVGTNLLATTNLIMLGAPKKGRGFSAIWK